MRIAFITTIAAACGLMAGCQGGSKTVASTPEIQSIELSQLSAGGGIAGYDFYVGLEKVGSLLVTNLEGFEVGELVGTYGKTEYYNQVEYWRWDTDALDDIRYGAVGQMTVSFVGDSEGFDATLVANFEALSSGAVAWQVNRLFTVGGPEDTEVQRTLPGTNGQALYGLEGEAWGDSGGTISYFMKMDFVAGQTVPEMTWYIEPGDSYTRWLASNARDGDTDKYEVRLGSETQPETVLTLEDVGKGIELATVE